MINYFLRLVKIALISTIGFGGGVGLLVFIIVMTSKGNAHAVQYGVTAGVVIGLICTALFFGVMMPLDILFRLSRAKTSKNKETTGIFDHKQSRKIVLQGTSKNVRALCREALLAIPGIQDVHDDMGHDQMTASTSTSLRSPGEKLEVQIYKGDGNQFHLHCVSYPLMKNAIFDYGKNFENVEIWKNKIEQLAKGGLGYNK